MELIPLIQAMLAGLESEGDDSKTGRRAALWRVQQRAANVNNTLDELRHYCLESLERRQLEDESEYMRGYRAGFQAILREIRRIETGGGQPQP